MGYDNVKLYVIPAAGGEPKDMAPDYDRTFGSVPLSDMPASGTLPLVWALDQQAIVLPSSINGTVHLVQVNLTTGKVKQITEGDRVIYSYSLGAKQDKAVLAVTTPLNPSELYLLDLTTRHEQRLTEVNKELLEQLELSEPQRYSFRAEGGPEVDGWVMKPIGFAEGKTYPAVLEIHGGPMMMYSCSFFFEFQLTAAKGYAVIYTNPRGSQGYGEEFCKAIQYEWGNKDWADVLAGLDAALAENPWIDGSRVGVAGGSYGGYMTAWAVGHTDRFKAANCGRPVVYWAGEVGTTDGGWLWMRRAKGVKPWVDDSWYKQQSPWSYVENMKTPLLIEVQEGDLRCPIEQGQMLYTAVKFLNKAPVKFVRYPNEFHGMSRSGKPWHRVHRLNMIVDWYNQYI
jgi:dipeptidyl aminopeptidase/acylaminoacyl peptidase